MRKVSLFMKVSCITVTRKVYCLLWLLWFKKCIHNSGDRTLGGTNASKIDFFIDTETFEHHLKRLIHSDQKQGKKHENTQESYQAKAANRNLFIHTDQINRFTRLRNLSHNVLMLFINLIIHFLKST